MQITPDDLFAEAGRMALEIRLMDQALAVLSEENANLRSQLGDGHTHGHEHQHADPDA